MKTIAVILLLAACGVLPAKDDPAPPPGYTVRYTYVDHAGKTIEATRCVRSPSQEPEKVFEVTAFLPAGGARYVYARSSPEVCSRGVLGIELLSGETIMASYPAWEVRALPVKLLPLDAESAAAKAR